MVSDTEQGMSLVELMVTISIIMIMALLGTPLTSGWIKNTHLNHAKNILLEGYMSARALALLVMMRMFLPVR